MIRAIATLLALSLAREREREKERREPRTVRLDVKSTTFALGSCIMCREEKSLIICGLRQSNNGWMRLLFLDGWPKLKTTSKMFVDLNFD
jgi:hypothetical protein